MMGHPNKVINENVLIETFFGEDDKIIIDSFDDRSIKVFHDLIIRISTISEARMLWSVLLHVVKRDNVI